LFVAQLYIVEMYELKALLSHQKCTCDNWHGIFKNTFVVNVNSRSRSLYVVVRLSVVCLSVVCNVRAPYSDDWNFRQCFYAI